MEPEKSQKIAGGFFDKLHDDLLVFILAKLSASADSPSDLLTAWLTCKRVKRLGSDPSVLSKASKNALAIRVGKSFSCGHRFLKLCADSGNPDALYMLGMIQFYCLEMHESGVSLMSRAALQSHPQALFSLAIIAFNGAGKTLKDAHTGFNLATRAGFLGHVDAIREVGLYCLKGAAADVMRGNRILALADELLDVRVKKLGVQVWDPHPANRFLREWFAVVGSGLVRGLCANGECGRRETKAREFRTCDVCRMVRYCSRVCQARHWGDGAHKGECRPFQMWDDQV